MTRLIIIDYGSGNLRSAAKACERAMHEHAINGQVIVSSDPAALATASHIVLPGVGAFGDCMQGIKSIPGMMAALHEQVRIRQTWFLGICVGMQLLFERGFEHGEHEGLGWIPGEVRPFTPNDMALKVPHMGWNALRILPPSIKDKMDTCPLLKGIDEGAYAYFVHSYHAQGVPSDYVVATTDYGGPVVAVVGKDTIFGTQFHPEKSQQAGLALLANFLKL